MSPSFRPFTKQKSIRRFQELNEIIYGLPNDRFFSMSDLIVNHVRFSMRALKGIRKKNKRKLTLNLLISFSFVMAVCNLLHLDCEDIVWNRFPLKCSYCGNCPCTCKIDKTKRRVKLIKHHASRPGTLSGFQKMFQDIYPSDGRTLVEAGIHMAEETGEVFESLKFFRDAGKDKQFNLVSDELADWVSCMFGVANSAKIDVATELEKLFADGCHVCHKVPCTCKISFVISYQS